MEKISFGGINMELTRRCNLRCSHCMRGEAQNIDVSNTVIDNLLDRTAGIERLSATGGEPLIAIDKLEYLIDGVIDRTIILCEFQIVTNGTLFDERTAAVIKKLHGYLTELYTAIYQKEFSTDFIKSKIQINISSDKYHDTDHNGIFDNIERLAGEYALVSLYGAGNSVMAKGRGKQLDCGAFNGEEIQQQIMVFGKNKPCHCRVISEERLKNQPDNYMVMCHLNVTANGIMTQYLETEYATEDLPKYSIADLNTDDDLISCIDKYNEDKQICVYTTRQAMNTEYHDDTIRSNRILFDYELNREKELQESDNPRYKKRNTVLELETVINKDGTPEEIAKSVTKAMEIQNVRSDDEIIAEAEYGIYSDIKKKYPTLTLEECQIFYSFIGKDETAAINKIEAYKKEHYKRAYYNKLKEDITGNDRAFKRRKDFRHLLNNRWGDDMQIAYEYFIKTDGKEIYGDNCTFDKFTEWMKLPDEYTTTWKWNRLKAAFMLDVQNIAANVECSGIAFSNDLDVREELYRRLAVFYCLDELMNGDEYRTEDMTTLPTDNGADIGINFTHIITAATGTRELYEQILECEPIVMAWQNSIDDEMGKPHTYTDQQIKKANSGFTGVMNLIKSIKLQNFCKAAGLNIA